MRTAIDTSVLLDVLVADPTHAKRSEASLRRASQEGSLVVSECVLAELRPALSTTAEVEALLGDWQIGFEPSTQQSALLAGEMFQRYLVRRGRNKARRVVADFLIGAHALCHADRLLARDRGYYRDYFAGLVLLTPVGESR